MLKTLEDKQNQLKVIQQANKDKREELEEWKTRLLEVFAKQT